MDRTAWIVIALCVVGLVLWEIYFTKQLQPRAAGPAQTPSAQLSPTPSVTANFSPSPSPSAGPANTPAAPESTPAFAEKIETLRNSDVEVRLTNRGGGIKEVILSNHVTEKDNRVILNSGENIPIGAIVDHPENSMLTEFTSSQNPDGSMQYERATPEHVTMRKKFYFPPETEKKDNYVIEMDVDFQNNGAQPYSTNEYFVALGSAAPLHPKDYPSFTR